MRDDVEARFVGLSSPTAPMAAHGANPCQGLYWTPNGRRPRVALIATHYNVDFAEHYLAPHFAAAGFGFLGWNTRYRGAEDLFLLEHALIDIGVGLRWLKERAGVERVVILGNSGGGSLMGAYQAEATAPTLAQDLNGAGRDALANLPAADLYISLNAHKGRPDVMTDWMDASVIDERDPTLTDETLNPFNAENGPPYGPQFIERYRAAQRARNQKITDWAKAELRRVNAAGLPDSLFPLFRTWGDLRCMDPEIDPSERPTPRCYRGHPAQANRGVGIGRSNSLRTWLSMWSLETSKCQGGPQLAKIEVPSLVVQSTADSGVFPSDAQAIFAALAGVDKQLELVPGAHYFETVEADRLAVVDLMISWLRERI